MVIFSRRQFFSSSPAVFGGTSILSACSHGPDPEGYEAVAARTRRVSSLAGLEGVSLSEQLVRYATLAPSSHNTQAALAHGLKAETSFDATRDAVRVTLAPTPTQTSSLFKANTFAAVHAERLRLDAAVQRGARSARTCRQEVLQTGNLRA